MRFTWTEEGFYEVVCKAMYANSNLRHQLIDAWEVLWQGMELRKQKEMRLHAQKQCNRKRKMSNQQLNFEWTKDTFYEVVGKALLDHPDQRQQVMEAWEALWSEMESRFRQLEDKRLARQKKRRRVRIRKKRQNLRNTSGQQPNQQELFFLDEKATIDPPAELLTNVKQEVKRENHVHIKLEQSDVE